MPVEADGSAYFEVPALRSLFFVALDEHDLAVKRMQSFVTVKPGETVGCVGCHEQRRAAGPAGRTAAWPCARPPSRIEPSPSARRARFPARHPADPRPALRRVPRLRASATGGVALTGDRGPIYSHSYFTLTARNQFADGRNRPKSNCPPRTHRQLGGSPLMKKLDGGHHDVQLSPRKSGRSGSGSTPARPIPARMRRWAAA